MAAIIMDGKTLAKKIKAEVRAEAEQLSSKPGMAFIMGPPPGISSSI